MRKVSVFAAAVVVLIAVSGAWQTAEAQNADLAGGWIVASRTSPNGVVNAEPQRGLYIFTASGQYSIMVVRGNEPRALPATQQAPTDAEKIAAYDSFQANSGRYSVEGNTITYEAYIAKNPNYMAGFDTDGGNAQTMTYSIEGGMLTLTTANGASVTLRRPGQQ